MDSILLLRKINVSLTSHQTLYLSPHRIRKFFRSLSIATRIEKHAALTISGAGPSTLHSKCPPLPILSRLCLLTRPTDWLPFPPSFP